MYDYKMIAAYNFRCLLKQRQLTQTEAAMILHVEERTLRRWLKDGIDKLSIIEEIASAFNIDPITTLLKKWVVFLFISGHFAP